MYLKEIINTGTYMGRVSELLQLLDSITIYNKNDQILINESVQKNKEWFNSNCILDTNSILFHNAACDSFLGHLHLKFCNIGLDYIDGKLIDSNGIQPVFLHGPGCIDISSYVRKLGYNADPPNIKEYSSFILKEYSDSFMYGILIIIFVIISIVVLLRIYNHWFKHS
ncbi:MAG TPA: hypothetical protein EYO58_11055 [Flavobacteriales bacterium]|nr:hypothetical protein [Flavobacteriales bacterium]